MGILDSNKQRMLQKSGSFNCDLTSSSAQNKIEFGGATYSMLMLKVYGITTEDVIITVKGNIVDSAETLPIYNKDGNDTIITGNGEYYVDCGGLDFIYFLLTRTAESGTASIKWSLFNKKKLSFNNSLKERLPLQTFGENAKTYSTASLADLEQFVNTTGCHCFVVNIESITSGSNIVVLDNVGRIINCYDSNGAISQDITKAGKYYFPIDTTTPWIKLRSQAAITSGQAQVRTSWMIDLPKDIISLKPIQLIKGFSSDIASANSFPLIAQNDSTVLALLRQFKYFFYSYYLTNGGSVVVKTCHITVQPYHIYGSTSLPGKSEELSVENSYSYQSEWYEIKGDAMRLYVKDDNYAEGDKIQLNLYGVR